MGEILKILIAEDEKRLSDALKQLFEDNKYITDTVYDGPGAVYYAMNAKYDVIVLDILMPDLDGFSVAKKLRENKNSTPIIMLTAKDSVKDKVEGLNSGADDYMTKPFSNEELLARVNALSRRKGEIIPNKLSFSGLTLNFSTSELSCGNNKLYLSHKEFEVMKILISNANSIVSKEQLIVHVWGTDSDVEENNVEAYISFLRKKIAFINSDVEIKALRKIGYRLKVKEDG